MKSGEEVLVLLKTENEDKLTIEKGIVTDFYLDDDVKITLDSETEIISHRDYIFPKEYYELAKFVAEWYSTGKDFIEYTKNIHLYKKARNTTIPVLIEGIALYWITDKMVVSSLRTWIIILVTLINMIITFIVTRYIEEKEIKENWKKHSEVTDIKHQIKTKDVR